MRKKTNLQLLIERLVVVPQGDRRFWARESKMAKELLALYGEEFLLQVPPREGYKSPSLAFFKTTAGKHYLSDQLFEYKKRNSNLVEEKKDVELASEKIGEDVVVQKKPRTLKDFLNYGKEDRREG
jgi:hypothetical protein